MNRDRYTYDRSVRRCLTTFPTSTPPSSGRRVYNGLDQGGLDCSTVGDGLIRVNALVGLLSVEKVGDELDDTRNTGGTTDQDDLVDVSLVDLGVMEDLLNGVEGASEEVLAQLLESSTSENGAREVWN